MLPKQGKIQFSEHAVLYDMLVPKNHVLRQINDLIDFSFVNEELTSKYCLDNGRVAEDPIKMFKYLLLKTICLMLMWWSIPATICRTSTFWG